MERKDYRQDVTNAIIEALESPKKWNKTWDSLAYAPYNMESGKKYKGGNHLHLIFTSVNKGYTDPRWCTYNQAQKLGYQVRKGEKSTRVEFWQFIKEDKKNNKGEILTRPIHRTYAIFNAQQMDNVPALVMETREISPIESAEKIINESGARILHDISGRAYYSPSKDEIHLPIKNTFHSSEDYYATALHELAHWTGHFSRLNRETLKTASFGTPDYAKEELRAEIASMFLQVETGISYNSDNHVAYLQSWLQALKKDKHEIFKAASDAEKIVDFLLKRESKEQEETLEETTSIAA